MAKKSKHKRPAPAASRPKTTPRAASGARRNPPKSERRFLYIVVALVAAVIAAVAVAQGGGGGDGKPADTASTRELLRTEAPWAPQTVGLQERVEAARFPPPGDESFHVHALLSVFVDGEQVNVPANIGIDPAGRFHSPLHTHTPDGVIHFEADEPAPFTLAQVFTMWGVELTADRLGAYTPEGGKRIYVYVNGEPVEDFTGYELQQGDNIVVAYGEDGSFPTEPPSGPLDNL